MPKMYPSRLIESTLPFQNIAVIVKIILVLTALLLPGVPSAQDMPSGQFGTLLNSDTYEFSAGYNSFRFSPYLEPVQDWSQNDGGRNFAQFATDLWNSANGDPRKMYEIGLKLHKNKGSESLGIDWIEKSARDGNVVAARYLSEFYLEGSGRPADPVRALEWLTEAVLPERSEAGLSSNIATLEDLYGADFP